MRLYTSIRSKTPTIRQRRLHIGSAMVSHPRSQISESRPYETAIQDDYIETDPLAGRVGYRFFFFRYRCQIDTFKRYRCLNGA